MSRFAIFVDGSNQFGTLRDLRLKVEDYGRFYRHVFARAAEAYRQMAISGERLECRVDRIYWYAVGQMDFWNFASDKTRSYASDYFQRNLANYDPAASPEARAQAFEAFYRECEAWYRKKRDSLDRMRRFYHSVRESTDFLEIVECGHWKVNPVHKTIYEKGLDTALAVDMVALLDNYDVALVLSGDADFIPSINHLKRRARHIGAVALVPGQGAQDRGQSHAANLRVAADFTVRILEGDLLADRICTKADQEDEGG